MIVRNNTYTIYKNHCVQVNVSRTETDRPVETPREEREYILSSDKGDLDTLFEEMGFQHSQHGYFFKVLKFEQLTNAFQVATFGMYKGKKVRVTTFLPEPDKAKIITYDKKLGIETGFYKFEDRDKGVFYKKLINKADLTRIWEERGPAFGLPMPERMKEKEMIDLNI